MRVGKIREEKNDDFRFWYFFPYPLPDSLLYARLYGYILKDVEFDSRPDDGLISFKSLLYTEGRG